MARASLDAGAELKPDQVALLLSRPVPLDETLPYWEAFQYLDRDRDFDYVAMGPRMPRVIKRAVFWAEGKRRHYSGDDLEDFVFILTAIDNTFVAEGVKAAAKARPPDTKPKPPG